jgi:hypothetical protein
MVNGQSVKVPETSVEHATVCVTVPDEIVKFTVPDGTQPVPFAVSAAGSVPLPDDSVNGGSSAPSCCRELIGPLRSKAIDPTETERLGPATEGMGDGEGPTGTWELPAGTVKL